MNSRRPIIHHLVGAGERAADDLRLADEMLALALPSRCGKAPE